MWSSFDTYGLMAFASIIIIFLLARSRVILYHMLSALVLMWFVRTSSRSLEPELLSSWAIMTAGLILYWFGLTIVRIMLVRSVSLGMLNGYAYGQPPRPAAEGVAARFEDAKRFALIREDQNQIQLTAFGRFISWIVVTSYWIFRVK